MVPLLVISYVLWFASFIAFVMIVIAAFEDEVWKGIVGFLFPLYLMYWAFAEYYDEGKWTKIGVWLGGGLLAAILQVAAIMTAIPKR